MAIVRQTLRAQIRAELVRRLTSGELPLGGGINEAQLAAELGVSRTPLREALIGLENEGLIESTVGKGFRFAPANESEFAELGPVLAVLESLALELSAPDHLKSIAPALIEKATNYSTEIDEHSTVMHHDAEWHDLLLSGCPNERLMELLTTLKVALRRYEVMLVPDQEFIRRSADEHLQVARCLAEGDLSGAIAALKLNWHNGTQQLLRQYAAFRDEMPDSTAPTAPTRNPA
ncbi:MAG TPA: GntR family transcriptional regulator [Mycobacteriales bacterium]|nr:GntR family transcriptional regulator [Mycobacteriales bacterium]